jgi:membrane fusion protein (multidrug efflux system)
MKALRTLLGFLVLAVLGTGTWIVIFHLDWLRPSEHEEDEGKIEAEVTVQVGKVVRATLHRTVDAYGTVVPEPANAGRPSASARLSVPMAGVIAECRCVEGQKVNKGDVLYRLDDRTAQGEEEKAAAAVVSAKASWAKLKATLRPEQILVAEAAVEKARRSADLAQRAYDRQKKLLEQDATAERKLQEAELQLVTARNELITAEQQLLLLKASPTKEELAEAEAKVVEAEKALAAARTLRAVLTVQAPLSGTLVRMRAVPGESADLTADLGEIVDLDRLVVQAIVPASALPLLKSGQKVELDFNPGDGEKHEIKHDEKHAEGLKGVLEYVSLEVDPKTDSVRARVRVPPGAGLRPGQYLKARIVVEEHENRLAVPRKSVVTDDEDQSLIALVKEGKAVLMPVHAGLREGDLVEIEGEGIQEGAVVVTAGAYDLPREAPEPKETPEAKDTPESNEKPAPKGTPEPAGTKVRIVTR